jgi:hypothetical protein
MRWSEEVQLLEEEMRRAIAFCTWRERWWLEQSDQSSESWSTRVPLGHQEGLSAYGKYQASVQQRLREGFEFTWRDIPKLLETYGGDSPHIDDNCR